MTDGSPHSSHGSGTPLPSGGNAGALPLHLREFEITASMIEAGAAEVALYGPEDSPRVIAEMVFRAMVDAIREAIPPAEG